MAAPTPELRDVQRKVEVLETEIEDLTRSSPGCGKSCNSCSVCWKTPAAETDVLKGGSGRHAAPCSRRYPRYPRARLRPRARFRALLRQRRRRGRVFARASHPNALRTFAGRRNAVGVVHSGYAALNEKNKDAARALAGAILGLLLLASGVLAVIGIAFAPGITALVAQGFDGPKREVTTVLVRILFPMTGLMVVSAWCLGILIPTAVSSCRMRRPRCGMSRVSPR